MKRFAACLSLGLVFCVASLALAENDTYKKSLIRGRANMGFTNSGTAEYKYQEVQCGGPGKPCRDTATGQTYTGTNGKNQKSQNLKELHQYTEVKGNVDAATVNDIGGVAVGQVPGQAAAGRDMRVIDNNIRVNGNVKGGRGDDVNIGGVTVGKGGKAKEIDTNVKVKGDIATGGDVNIGGVNIEGGQVGQVNSSTVIDGDVVATGRNANVNVGGVTITNGTVSGVNTQTKISGNVNAK
jgi:hypothetical protein